MASTRQRGQKFTGLYRDAQGRQKSAGSFNTEREALKAAEHAEAVANPPEHVAAFPVAVKGKPTFAAYGRKAIAGATIEPTTRNSYNVMFGKHVEPALGGMIMADLSPADIRGFVRGLETGHLSASTVRWILCVIRMIVRTAVVDGILGRDVTMGISVKAKSHKERAIATPEQAKAIVATIDPYYALMAETLFATGLRFSETAPLKASDILDGGPGRKVIRVRHTVTELNGKYLHRDYGKTPDAMRDVPVSDDLAARLIAQGEKDPEGVIFRGKQGAYIRRTIFWRVWRAACDATGLPDLTVHGARHSVASWLANTPGLPLVLVKEMLGHSNIAVTDTYVHAIHNDGDDPRLAALATIAA
jgi:integrase